MTFRGHTERDLGQGVLTPGPFPGKPSNQTPFAKSASYEAFIAGSAK